MAAAVSGQLGNYQVAFTRPDGSQAVTIVQALNEIDAMNKFAASASQKPIPVEAGSGMGSIALAL